MSLQRCTLSWQAFNTCCSHAMSTEKQEVMGLLLGRWEEGRDGNTQAAVIEHAMILTRTDKQEDRVEVGYQQLAEASSIAERMSAQLGKATRVVGWYHSHPHITVLPSHVDVRTQGQYQSMDRRFIGLIFSVFNDDKNSKVGTIEVTAFQARDNSVTPEAEAGEASARAPRGPAEWVRKEVPLSMHRPGPGSSTTPLSDALERVVRLQDTLFGEERQGYLNALKQHEAVQTTERVEEMTLEEEAQGEGQGTDLLSKMMCAAVYTRSVTTLTGESAVPLAETLRSQLNNLRARARALERRQALLRTRLSPEELEQAAAMAREKARQPCSAAIGVFQAHEGEQNIPRADALRFARNGSMLRRTRLLSTSALVPFKVVREYPGAVASNDIVAASPLKAAPGAKVETIETGSGRWVLHVGGRKMTLKGLRAADRDGGARSGLVFETVEDGAIEATCEDKEAFRMWLGVAAAVCPAGPGSSE